MRSHIKHVKDTSEDLRLTVEQRVKFIETVYADTTAEHGKDLQGAKKCLHELKIRRGEEQHNRDLYRSAVSERLERLERGLGTSVGQRARDDAHPSLMAQPALMNHYVEPQSHHAWSPEITSPPLNGFSRSTNHSPETTSSFAPRLGAFAAYPLNAPVSPDNHSHDFLRHAHSLILKDDRPVIGRDTWNRGPPQSPMRSRMGRVTSLPALHEVL